MHGQQNVKTSVPNLTLFSQEILKVQIEIFKVLFYKSEGRWFDPSWGQWIFR